MKLISVTKSNCIQAIKIKPDSSESHQLHYNAYWIGQSYAHDDIKSYLIDNGSEIIGFVCFGQCYSDEYLLSKESKGISELYQLIIKPSQQNSGHGKEGDRRDY